MKRKLVLAQNETAELGGQKFTLKLNLNWCMSSLYKQKWTRKMCLEKVPARQCFVANNVLHICDGRAFWLKCSLGKRINQLLKSRQTETNCTPIANVLLAAEVIVDQFSCQPEIASLILSPRKLNLWIRILAKTYFELVTCHQEPKQIGDSQWSIS